MEIIRPKIESLPSDPFFQILQRGLVVKQGRFEQHHGTRFDSIIQKRKLISVIPMENQVACQLTAQKGQCP